MGFKREEVADLLVKCNRCCCICHRFCGIKIETDHITPKSDSHDDDIENAIPLCFDCHAEVHLYNDRHPRGRKYTSEELILHKKRWIEICEENPNVMENKLESKNNVLLSLIAELEFNELTAKSKKLISIPFETNQFHMVLNSGILSFLDPKVKDNIFVTYVSLKESNRLYNVMVKSIEDNGELHAATRQSKSEYDNAIDISLNTINKTMNIISNILNNK